MLSFFRIDHRPIESAFQVRNLQLLLCWVLDSPLESITTVIIRFYRNSYVEPRTSANVRVRIKRFFHALNDFQIPSMDFAEWVVAGEQ